MRITRLTVIRWTAAMVLAAYLPACTSYHVLANPAEAIAAAPKPIDKVRITMVNGKRFEMTKVRVEADSLRGLGYGVGERGIALSDIKQVEVAKPSPEKTVGLVLGIGAFVGLTVAVAAAMADWGSESCTVSGDGGYY
ncbi:MAG TPA: hypothetical protein VFO06_01795 [Gemmatimonadales bacterium]|nr:hypothetical protein [Gemmatimonadales bacterium]